MNESVHNSTGSRSELGDREDGHVMSTDSGTSASLMQSAVLTDLQLIYMLQQQQQGGAGEAAMMLSPGSLPLLMSSCQVMALHPSVSQQFVSSSSTGTSPSSLARSPLLAPDGSIIWHPAATDDQMSDNFDEDHNQGTSFSQHLQGNGGLSQQPESPVVSRNPLQAISHQQPLTVNGNLAAYPGYAVVNATSGIGHSSGFVASAAAPKVVVTASPKTTLAAPKKPLTPYMKFSKSIWQHVKNANPSLSVCEVGASIGRLWREMSDTDKQKYNDEFQREKVVYEAELQSYLRATGLQVSDLVKTKKKDTRDRNKASATPMATPNQNYMKNAMTSPLSLSTTLASGHEGSAEGTRLPHISQMWSGHSGATQEPQVTSQVQNMLKTVCDPFENARLKTVEVNNQSHDAHSPPGGATIVSSEMPSGLSWTWIKAVDPMTNDANRPFSLEAFDSLQSAYMSQDQGSLSSVSIPANQQPLMDFYSASDSLEPGEVVVEGRQQTLIAKACASLQNGSVASAHNIYNSYAVNPWNRYKLAATGPKFGEAIFDKEQILHTELVHLRGSLSEKTKEVEQLSKELEIAYALIGKLQQQENPSSHPALHPGDATTSTLHPTDQPDGNLVSQEAGREHSRLLPGTIQTEALQNDTESRDGMEPAQKNAGSVEPVLEKQELNSDVDMKPIGSVQIKVSGKYPHGINVLHSIKMQDVDLISEPDGSVAAESSLAEDQPENIKIVPSRQSPLITLASFSAPERSHQISPISHQWSNQPASNKMEVTIGQPVVVAQVPEQQNVTLQLESNMQHSECKAQQNQELEVESVAPDRQEVVSEKMASTAGSLVVGLKDPSEAVREEMVQP